MKPSVPPRAGALDEDRALRAILEGTAAETGSHFFRALVRAVADSLDVHGAWVTEFTEDGEHLRALAFWLGDKFIEDFEYRIAGTPCADVIRDRRLVHISEGVSDMYPQDRDLREAGAASYLSAPLPDTDGTTVLGNLALIHTDPLEVDDRILAVFRIFAARTAAEVRRLRAEQEVRAREEELALLVESAMDAILEMDPELRMTRVNRAAVETFHTSSDYLLQQGLAALLSTSSHLKVQRLMAELLRMSEEHRSLWVPGGLEAIRTNGERFPAEATLSSFEFHGQNRYTLILRDVDARQETERRLRHLTAETEYLREELRSLENFGEIAGRSAPVLRMLQDVQRVARTDATVLVMGETGTGKELVARAIHESSDRKNAPLVRVNCAAIPAPLIESEFFGHEKGAFTGATSRREGRFALADGGTILLDEVGELPPELQAKLLRVLQEGEFEPVGSDRTRKVDVRVIAATNRYLEAAVRAGDFREDLYYRLNVFPIVVPPLRERGEDVVLLAQLFLKQFAGRMGRTLDALSEPNLQRLRAYSWPGNVRELRNVIERAVITERNGRADLSGILPDSARDPGPTPPRDYSGPPSDLLRPAGRRPEASCSGLPGTPGILSQDEFRQLERENLLRALAATGWQISGEEGAARLLGIPASTLASRIRSLELQRPGTVSPALHRGREIS